MQGSSMGKKSQNFIEKHLKRPNLIDNHAYGLEGVT